MFRQVLNEVETYFSNFFSPEKLGIYLVALVKIGFVLLITKLVMRFAKFFISKVFQEPEIKGSDYNLRRVQTLKSLTISITHYVIYFLAGITILEIFQFPVTSLLAGAGIFGLAVGFGTQGLIKDVISGFFILFEAQFSVGDHVKVGDIEGIVLEIGLKSTKIKSFAGQIHIVPNGQISIVTNFIATDSMRVMFDVGVAYEEDLERVIKVLEEICQEYGTENPKLVEGPKVLGIQELGEYAVSIRLLAKTVPLEQWGVERELKLKIKQAFDEQDIEIPYPKKVLFMEAQEAVGEMKI